MKKLFLLVFVLVIFSLKAYTYAQDYKYPKRVHSESSYQHLWCKMNAGIEEYQNEDFTRVDCLTKTHAVEFDFANKWAEGVGQSLHYQRMTGKKAKVVLILENPKKEMVYFERVKALGDIHNFDVEYITSEVFNLKSDKCPYLDCKCNK